MEQVKRGALRTLVVLLMMALSLTTYHNVKVNAGVLGSVIINEMMYNPGSGNQADEFLELYNTTASPVNLDGWCFTQGISICFSSSDVIAAHGYLVISPDPAQYGITYDLTTDNVYSGNLSNGGETLTLKDESNTTIDSVTYEDSSPWPTSPDGNGPSLELKNPSMDGSQVASWGASLNAGGTPAAQNSLVGFNPPVISSVTKPSDVQTDETATVTAEIDEADGATLFYKVMFESEQSIPMHDDGSHGDGAADDGVYGATLPAAAVGQLVRYKIVAQNESGANSSPGSDDSQNYHGYVVQDPSVTSQLPILQWFIPEQSYQEMINLDYGDTYTSCILVYGDQVFDNTQVRIKGEYSRSFPKKSYKFKLPSGYKIHAPEYFERDVSEFHMNSEWLDESKAMTKTIWDMAKESGMDTPSNFGTRLQRNGQYEGYYLAFEKYEKEYRQAKGYDGELFEDTFEKVQPDDDNTLSIELFRDTLWSLEGDALREYFFDNVDVPKITNFAAFEAVINSHDWGLHNNTFQYKDTNGTGRWSLWMWDRDIAMDHNPRIITPYTVPPYFGPKQRAPATTLYDQPEGRQMYFRRLRTLADTYYGSDNRLLQMYRDNVALSAPEAALDLQKWGEGDDQNGFWTMDQSNYEWAIAKNKKTLLARYRLDRAVPAAQQPNPLIEISQVHVSFSANDSFVQLHNPGSSAVDLSGWYLEELNYDFPHGTVLAAGNYAVIPRNDISYRTDNPGSYIISELPQDIPGSGQVTLRRSEGSQADVTWF